MKPLVRLLPVVEGKCETVNLNYTCNYASVAHAQRGIR